MEEKKAARSFGGVMEKVYKNRHGRVRLVVGLAAALAALAVCLPLAEWLYWSGFNALTRLWGVTERNIARAPWAVRQFARYSGVPLTLIQSGLLLVCSRRLIRVFKLSDSRGWAGSKPGRRYALGLARGAGGVLALWLALIAFDNMRLGRSLTRPAWSASALILPVTQALFAAAVIGWGLGLVYRFLSERIPWPFAAAVSAVLLVPALMDSYQFDGLFAVNLLLCGAVCCLSAKKTGGWAWAAGFLFGVWLLERAVLGFPGYTAALYETYPVNHYWLNGGERGLWHGAAMTILLLVNALPLLRPLRKRSAS